MSRSRDGTIIQSAHNSNSSSLQHERIYYPVLGVVITVHPSDDRVNKTAAHNPNQRGSQCEATVLVLNDGADTTWVIPNVVILPRGSSGVDNYHEELPRPSTLRIDGSPYSTSLAGVDLSTLDGDWCVVSFIGGSIEQPVMTGWFPHPGNTSDPATAGLARGALDQGRRLFKRFQGCKLTITNEGTVVVDTSESGSLIKGEAGIKRKKRDKGGDVLVTLKKNRKLDINFNPPVFDPAEPGIPAPVNEDGRPPASPPKADVRSDEVTRLTMDQNLVELVAGQVLKLLTRNDNIQIIAEKVAQIVGTQGGVELGGVDLASNTGVVQGECIEPLTGMPWSILGQTSSIVKAKK